MQVKKIEEMVIQEAQKLNKTNPNKPPMCNTGGNEYIDS